MYRVELKWAVRKNARKEMMVGQCNENQWGVLTVNKTIPGGRH